MAMFLLTLSNQCAVLHADGGEECRGAVTFVIVCHRTESVGVNGETLLSTIKCLYLALLITRQHQRMLRRIEVQANYIH